MSGGREALGFQLAQCYHHWHSCHSLSTWTMSPTSESSGYEMQGRPPHAFSLQPVWRKLQCKNKGMFEMIAGEYPKKGSPSHMYKQDLTYERKTSLYPSFCLQFRRMYSCSAMVHLAVTPESALADEPVKIKAWGLPPRQFVTIRAWLKDDRGEMFYSRAFYESNDEGEVDLQHSPATGGDFQGVHPMGLFWALKPVTPHFRLLKRDVMGSPFEVHLELYGHLEFDAMPECSPEATATLRRWYVTPGVQRLQVREGRLRGALFIPPGEGPFRGVIDLYGGFGGLIEFRSSLLASRGFATLALAYFAYEDLPKTLDCLDLKYFEEAAQFLSNHPKVYGSGVGVIGVSKGAEMALAMASYLPQVAAAVCINGPVAIIGTTVSYGDFILPEIPYRRERMMYTQSGGSIMFHIFVDPTDPEHQACMLPVEKAKGPILFLVGENDQCCNSLRYARASLARAKEYGKTDVYIESYPGAGHLIEPPCSPFCPLSRSPSSPVPVLWGGELVAHCRAQEITWPGILDFLCKNIPCSKKNKL